MARRDGWASYAEATRAAGVALILAALRRDLSFPLHRDDLPTNPAAVASELRKAAQLWNGADQPHRAPALRAAHFVRFVPIPDLTLLHANAGPPAWVAQNVPRSVPMRFPHPMLHRQPEASKTHGQSHRATGRQLPPRATSAARDGRSGQPESVGLLRRLGTENCGIRENLPTSAICGRASSHRCNAGIGVARPSPTCQR